MGNKRQMKMEKKINMNKGQSVVEYLFLFSIISLATFLVLNMGDNKFLEDVQGFAGEIFRISIGRLQTPRITEVTSVEMPSGKTPWLIKKLDLEGK